MLPDIELLVSLEGLDLRAAEHKKQLDEIPKEFVKVRDGLATHKRRLDSDRATLGKAKTDRKLLDTEIAALVQKIEKLKDQMTGAKTNEQYHAFQKEIGYCQEQIRKVEDRVLELMSLLEGLDSAVSNSEGRLKEEEAEIERFRAEAKQQIAQHQKHLAEIERQRTEVSTKLTRPGAAIYAKLSRRYPGSMVSDATKGQCTACQLVLRPQLFQDLRKRDKMLMCENCGRLLHYNPATEFDPQTGSSGSRVDMT
ncbi:MAG: hypothetical protein FJW39_01865 [Acidobacteria bacterium]|nr:hypothetical protein [Acidobacteriota bacterium]